VDNSVEVRYAGVVVGRGAIVKDLDVGSAFVGVSEPLPVGTLVTLKIGDAVHEARVDDVVESSEPTAVGMRVSWGGAPRASAPAPRAPAPRASAPTPRVEPPAVASAPAPAPEPVQPVAALEAAPLEPVAAPEDAGSAIPAPMSLAGPGAEGSHQGGGKKRRKRR
jgi:hypothetical protein